MFKLPIILAISHPPGVAGRYVELAASVHACKKRRIELRVKN